jgi:hypothetical protein
MAYEAFRTPYVQCGGLRPASLDRVDRDAPSTLKPIPIERVYETISTYVARGRWHPAEQAAGRAGKGAANGNGCDHIAPRMPGWEHDR